MGEWGFCIVVSDLVDVLGHGFLLRDQQAVQKAYSELRDRWTFTK